MTQYLQNKNRYIRGGHVSCGNQRHHQLLGEGYWGYSYSSLASANSYPWNARDMYTLQSPLFNADKINTPILFLTWNRRHECSDWREHPDVYRIKIIG